jgi:WD40 repeat protein
VAAPAHAVTLSPDGILFATALHNSPARLYDIVSGRVLTNSGSFAHFDYSPDNRWIGSSSGQGFRILRRPSLALAAEIPLEPSAYDGPRPWAFSPDSRLVALPYNQVDVRLYRVPDGDELATLPFAGSQRIARARSLEFSRDGRWLLALHEDGEVVAWDLLLIRRELRRLGLDWRDAQPPTEGASASRR